MRNEKEMVESILALVPDEETKVLEELNKKETDGIPDFFLEPVKLEESFQINVLDVIKGLSK